MKTFFRKKSLVPDISGFVSDTVRRSHSTRAGNVSRTYFISQYDTVQKWIQLTGLIRRTHLSPHKATSPEWPFLFQKLWMEPGSPEGFPRLPGDGMRSHPAKCARLSSLCCLSIGPQFVSFPSRLCGAEAGGHFYKRSLICLSLWLKEHLKWLSSVETRTLWQTGDSLTPTLLLISGVLFVFGPAPVEPDCVILKHNPLKCALEIKPCSLWAPLLLLRAFSLLSERRAVSRSFNCSTTRTRRQWPQRWFSHNLVQNCWIFIELQDFFSVDNVLDEVFYHQSVRFPNLPAAKQTAARWLRTSIFNGLRLQFRYFSKSRSGSGLMNGKMSSINAGVF